jgi:hypothetical protein
MVIAMQFRKEEKLFFQHCFVYFSLSHNFFHSVVIPPWKINLSFFSLTTHTLHFRSSLTIIIVCTNSSNAAQLYCLFFIIKRPPIKNIVCEREREKE